MFIKFKKKFKLLNMSMLTANISLKMRSQTLRKHVPISDEIELKKAMDFGEMLGAPTLIEY